MSKDTLTTADSMSASLISKPSFVEELFLEGTYTVECVGSDGKVKWTDTIKNLVTTVGKNDILDKYLAGSAYTASFVMGLKGVGTAVVGDTQSSHAGWSEVGGSNAPTYTGNRQVPAFSAASSGTKATSSAVSYAITSSGTVAGCFINSAGSATKDNTTGVLFSAGDFTGGNKVVANGDTLNVSYSLAV